MSFLILVLQSIRYGILALALKLFNYAEFIETYCVRISHSLEHHDIGTSRTASCRPVLDSGHTQQSEHLRSDAGSSTSNDWSGTESENDELVSDHSSRSSTGSIASAPESTSNLRVSPTQDAPASVQLSDVSVSAKSLWCPSKPIAFSFGVANATKAAPAGHGNLFPGGGYVCDLLGHNDQGVDRGVAAINAPSSGASNERPVLLPVGTSVIPFTPTICQDLFNPSKRKAHQTITAMQAYKNYSFEELRFAHYCTGFQFDNGMRDLSTTTPNKHHLSASCAVAHGKTRSVMSEMQEINRELTAWRNGSLSVQASPDSGLGLHLLIAGAGIYRPQLACKIFVLDRTARKYVPLSEALTWCGGENRTGLAVTIGTSQSPKLLCCSDQVMPSILQHSTTVTIFVWDTGLRAFVVLEDMLATEASRTRANLRIGRHRWEYERPVYRSRCDSTTWRDFVASADFDGIILERLLAKEEVEPATRAKLLQTPTKFDACRVK